MSVNKSAVTGMLPRRCVYSATIKNETSDTVHCCVEYSTLSGTDNEIIEFDIKGNGEEQKCEAKVHQGSTTNTNSTGSTIFPKTINAVQVRKSNGSQLEISAPFDNVPYEDVHNWIFTVKDDKIYSGKN